MAVRAIRRRSAGMTIPDFQTVMRPLLAHLTDGKVIHYKLLADALAADLGLTEVERAVMLPSGKQRTFDNRIGWATSHLFQAGLLTRPQRAHLQLTDAGRDALERNPERIDVPVLRGYESYREFRSRSARAVAGTDDAAAVSLITTGASPLALLEQAVAENTASLQTELLNRALALSPRDFERLVVTLLERMGYGASGAVEHSGRSGDGGIDAVVSQDPLGLDRIFVQAKRYAPDQAVQRPTIQAFVGALMGAQGDRGVFITTSRFSEGARVEAERVNARIELIDGPRLGTLMLRHGVGVQAEATVTLHRVDEDFFDGL